MHLIVNLYFVRNLYKVVWKLNTELLTLHFKSFCDLIWSRSLLRHDAFSHATQFRNAGSNDWVEGTREFSFFHVMKAVNVPRGEFGPLLACHFMGDKLTAVFCNQLTRKGFVLVCYVGGFLKKIGESNFGFS